MVFRHVDKLAPILSEILIPFGLLGGVFLGLFFGLVMGFWVKGDTITVEVEDREAFLEELDVALGKIHYNPESESQDIFMYKPSAQAGLVSEKIGIQLHECEDVLFGLKNNLKKLLK